MNSKFKIILLATAIAAQLAAPALMIAKWESTLDHGELFKFRTAPVDPADAFRGRYVALSVASNTVAWTGNAVAHGSVVYVSLAVDEDGFAAFASASQERPDNVPYLIARAGWLHGGQLHLNLPFDRFYMTEKEAPAAEKAYQRGREEHTAYIAARILNGRAVIEDLYIDDLSIRDFLKRNHPDGK